MKSEMIGKYPIGTASTTTPSDEHLWVDIPEGMLKDARKSMEIKMAQAVLSSCGPGAVLLSVDRKNGHLPHPTIDIVVGVPVGKAG